MKKIIILVMMASMLMASSCGSKDNTKKIDTDKAATSIKNDSEDEKKEEAKSEEDKTEETVDEDKATEEEKELNNVTKNSVDKKLEEEKFSYNEELKFREDKKYKFTELENSAPLKNTDGFIFEGEFYEDKYSAIDTVLKFNDAWINYVNTNDGSVFTYTSKGSEAYNDILAFNTKNLTERFLLMEIGDVRRVHSDGEVYFYVWTHEKIEENRDGNITVREYKWIYKMKREEMDFKIVNFTRDTK